MNEVEQALEDYNVTIERRMAQLQAAILVIDAARDVDTYSTSAKLGRALHAALADYDAKYPREQS